ncbi:hypothetical protein RUM43_009861 [Polyplax serrata]|uniref:F-box domain-containing protein n=1 Tax=Polyplax serrata TaxID=468196 RepID=A0AAN8P3C9_POLSC
MPEKEEESDISPFQKVPTEIFLYICSLLQVKDLVGSLGRVCKRFHFILSDANFWKTLVAKRWNYKYPLQSIDNDNFDWKRAGLELEKQWNLWKSREETVRRMNVLPNVHIAAVDAVLFIANSVCVSASRDRSLVVWNPTKSTNRFPSYVQKSGAHEGWIWRLQSSRDSLYSCSWDNSIKIWAFDSSDLHHKTTFRCCSPVLSMTLRSDTVVAGDYGKYITAFDPRRGDEPVFRYSEHRRAVLTLGSVGSDIISGSEDRTLVVWDSRIQKVRQTIVLGQERFPNCSCTDDNIFYVGDSKGCVHVFTTGGESVKRLKVYNIGHQKPISVIKNGRSYLLTGSHDGTVKISLPIQPLKVLTSIKTSRGEVGGMDYKGGILAVGTSNYLEFWMPKEYLGSDLEDDSNYLEADFRSQFD